MKRSIVLPGLVTAFVALSPVGVAFATPSPGVPGGPGTPAQPGAPNVEAGEDGVGPGPPGQTSGFNTGFANAQAHYAGSDGTPSLANGNPRAVSQYDVAAFQLTPGVHHQH